MEPGSSWWCRAIGQEAMDRNWCTEVPPELFYSAGDSALKQIAERSYGGSLKGDIPVWTQHCAMCSGCLSREVGSGDPLLSFPTLAIHSGIL